MAHFQFPHELQAFEGVELLVDYRLSGTVYADGTVSFDSVEVYGRGDGLSRDGWRQLSPWHALYRAAARYCETRDATNEARRALSETEADLPRRPFDRGLPLVSRPHPQAAE